MYLSAFILLVLFSAPPVSAETSVTNSVDIQVSTGGNRAAPGERIETGPSSVTLDVTTRVNGTPVERVSEQATSSIVYRSTTTVANEVAHVERTLEKEAQPVLLERAQIPLSATPEVQAGNVPLPTIIQSASNTPLAGEEPRAEQSPVLALATRVLEVIARTITTLFHELFT